MIESLRELNFIAYDKLTWRFLPFLEKDPVFKLLSWKNSGDHREDKQDKS